MVRKTVSCRRYPIRGWPNTWREEKREQKKEKLNNKWQDSVTYVLTHECYLCPDRAPPPAILHLLSSILSSAAADAPRCLRG